MNTENKLRIMVVDDEPTARLLVSAHFSELGFDIVECETGEACLAEINEKISMVMLDVGLPGIDGIETCRQLRAAGYDKTQVIFISAHDDLATRLTAYDAGGSDFIVKPFEYDEIERKVRVAERNLAALEAVSGQAKFAQQAAFTAMSSMGEMGIVLDFVRKSFACESIQELSNAVFENLQQFGLEGLLSLQIDGVVSAFSRVEPCSPLEASILENTRTLQRIFQFSNRLAINYSNATLLITGMPVHDPDLCGRLRDHLAVVVECAHTRVGSIHQQAQLKRQNDSVTAGMEALLQAIQTIKTRYQESTDHARDCTNEYMKALEDAFVHLGLTERQENELVNLAKTSIGELVSLLDQNKNLDLALQDALTKFAQYRD